MWNSQQKKGKLISLITYQMNTVAGKLSGHLSNCSAMIKNPRLLVSGSLDTNVKVWDARMKSCISTFKGHNEQITCVDISPDSLNVVSGSMDGTVKLWDLRNNKMSRSIQVSTVGHPECLQFNPKDLCLAVGSSDKIVRYWELQDYSLVSQTTIENSVPSHIHFDPDGRYAFVSFSEFVKLYILENDVGRCHLLDVIPKSGNCQREVLDMKINFGEQGFLFLCE